MKKILALILALGMVLSLAGCKEEIKEETEANTSVTEEKTEDTKDTAEKEEMAEETEEKQEEKEDESKPAQKPAQKPVEKPVEKPEQSETQTSGSVGNVLLADFMNKASSMDALSLAEALITNPVIPFMGGAMAVEPGYLTGFDNNEIKGFKEGAMFSPMIGTTPFVGYVFTLESASDASAFVNNLKSSANLRWNICTEADEMVSGISGNKVFFVMSPLAFEE